MVLAGVPQPGPAVPSMWNLFCSRAEASVSLLVLCSILTLLIGLKQQAIVRKDLEKVKNLLGRCPSYTWSPARSSLAKRRELLLALRTQSTRRFKNSQACPLRFPVPYLRVPLFL